MKKILFMAAIAAAALSSCSSDEIVEQVAQKPVVDGAVMFSAYTGRQTRATTITTDYLKGYGFGVFAYEQSTTPWNTYRVNNSYPNFFYNQKVSQGDVTAWDILDDLTTARYEEIADATLKAKYSETTPGAWSRPDIDKATYDALTSAAQAGYTAKDYTNGTTTKTKAEYDAMSAGTEKDAYVIKTYTDTPKTYAEYTAITEAAIKSMYAETTKAVWGTTATLSATEYAALTVAADRALCVPKTTSETTWKYAPVKYYSNNEGALHSFFAYAPYDKNVKAVFSNEGPAVRYSASDDYDLLWAAPTVDKKKAAISSDEVTFVFNHALSKLAFQASTFVDVTHGTHDPSAVEENTTVVLRSVKFVGNVPSKGLLNLTDGTWKIEASEESAYEFAPVTGIVFDKDNTGYTNVSSDNMVIPTSDANRVKVQVVYDVITKDPSNPQNSSTITNIITSKDEYVLAAGTAYTFKLDLGLKSVEFTATVSNWNAGDGPTIDLPNND